MRAWVVVALLGFTVEAAARSGKPQADLRCAVPAQGLLAEEAAVYAEAQALGVTAAVARATVSERQKRPLAIAIVREARRNGLDPLLVVAVIQKESSFDNYATSEVGAMGLMQVMPKTGTWLLSRRGESLGRRTALFDFELNIELGTAYLAELIGRFGSVEKALVAYNAGPGAARRILADRQARERFVAGYPRQVLSELARLRRRAGPALNAEAVADPVNVSKKF